MPFLPGPDDAVGDPADVGDALTPGQGKYGVDFKEVYDFLCTHNISEQVNNEKDLAQKIMKNFDNQNKVSQQQINLLNTYGKKILTETIAQLKKFV